MAWFIIFVLLFLAFSFFFLRGQNLTYLDTNILPQPEGQPSEGHHEVLASLKDMAGAVQGFTGKRRLIALREHLDAMSDDREYKKCLSPD